MPTPPHHHADKAVCSSKIDIETLLTLMWVSLSLSVNTICSKISLWGTICMVSYQIQEKIEKFNNKHLYLTNSCVWTIYNLFFLCKIITTSKLISCNWFSYKPNNKTTFFKYIIRAFLSKMLKTKFYHQHTKILTTSKISNTKNFDKQLQWAVIYNTSL